MFSNKRKCVSFPPYTIVFCYCSFRLWGCRCLVPIGWSDITTKLLLFLFSTPTSVKRNWCTTSKGVCLFLLAAAAAVPAHWPFLLCCCSFLIGRFGLFHLFIIQPPSWFLNTLDCFSLAISLVRRSCPDTSAHLFLCSEIQSSSSSPFVICSRQILFTTRLDLTPKNTCWLNPVVFASCSLLSWFGFYTAGSSTYHLKTRVNNTTFLLII